MDHVKPAEAGNAAGGFVFTGVALSLTYRVPAASVAPTCNLMDSGAALSSLGPAEPAA